MAGEQDYRNLAAYRHCVARLHDAWPRFQAQRADLLRHGDEKERVAEEILRALFVGVLDWSEGDLDYQKGRADIVVTHNLAKYLVIEVKRPGTLVLGRSSLDAALDQARSYADEQRIERLAVSDGRLLYAVNRLKSGHFDEPRVTAYLDAASAPEALWWLSVHGIYRPHRQAPGEGPDVPAGDSEPTASTADGQVLHPKYHLPASCFAYVGDANDPRSWKLPYLQAGGEKVDPKRLPKAIQALLSNYRGAKVRGIPEKAVLDILLRLARAAAREGLLPDQSPNPAAVYMQLVGVLRQQGVSARELCGGSS